ncbi:MAG: rhombotarget lipoprotein [Mariprofundaceae bacterium]|nr:rhombotarget lipoprotein [Mariprofundaceae bacterium]
MWFRVILSIGLMLLMASCATNRNAHHSSSVVQYLYPNVEKPMVSEQVPHLRLPLRVGIAFVPEQGTHGQVVISEEEKVKLMRNIGAHFKQYDFVKHIEVIPGTYLRSKGSFSNLDQIATMFGIDVVALISYDQSRFTANGLASIVYWTIVGAYVVPGEKNDTHTMVDAVVYDVASRKMLFRAPGVSHLHSNATPINLSEQLRLDAHKGFEDASKDLIVSLDKKLQEFRERVKNSPTEYKVEHREGYGGGSLGFFELLLLLSSLMLMRWQHQRQA